MNNELDIFGGGNAPVKTATTEMMVSRQAQEVQAAMVIAKRFPRDEQAAYSRILNACSRRTLAEKAMYEFPRGGSKITGASIELAKSLAQNWGNIDFGIIELEQKGGKSQVMSYAWDLETNTRQTKVFDVPHIRQTKKGAQSLTDPRDIYELVANQGSRRMRACILGLIPGDVVDGAIKACEQTLAAKSGTPLATRVGNMARAFTEQYGVSIPMIENVIGCNISACSENDFIKLCKIFQSISDGMASPDKYFDFSMREVSEEPAEKEVNMDEL